MFGNLKDKLYSLQGEITASVKHLTPVQIQSGLRVYAGNHRNLEAGGDLLEHWQESWEEIHTANEHNSNKARHCDKLIAQINRRTDRQWSQIMAIQNLVATQTPIVNNQIEAAMDKLAKMESLFSDVEVSLLALEDTIDAREIQEKQLEQKFQLAIYQEKRRAEFNDLSTKLQMQFDKKKAEIETKRLTERKEKQEIYQRMFEKDMDAHRAIHGECSSNFLKPPKGYDPDASLETVDLNDDNDGCLEKFLNEDDLLYDASPLPKDEDKTLPSSHDDMESIQPITSSASVAESLYYTPDSSVNEKLSELQ